MEIREHNYDYKPIPSLFRIKQNMFFDFFLLKLLIPQPSISVVLLLENSYQGFNRMEYRTKLYNSKTILEAIIIFLRKAAPKNNKIR